MILKELSSYYQRMTQGSRPMLPPEGFEWKSIPFIIVIDSSGQFLSIEDTRIDTGKNKRAKSFLVPQSVKRGLGAVANTLWDTAEYVLGIQGPRVSGATTRKHRKFVEGISRLSRTDVGVQAVSIFLENIPLEQIESSKVWDEIERTNPYLSFQLSCDNVLVCQRDAVIDAVKSGLRQRYRHSLSRVCLVSGEVTSIERVHPRIKGVWGAHSYGASLVSFGKPAFESYGKQRKQGENAPISKNTVFAYTAALNHLLSRDSAHRIQVGDASTVFWAEKSHPFETAFGRFFAEPPPEDPGAIEHEIEVLHRSEGKSAPNDVDLTRFFVLGLSPNVGRLSVRFWETRTIREFSQSIADYFMDLSIDHAPYEPPYLSLFRILFSTACQGNADNILPNLAGDMMRAILSDLPYPETLLIALIHRIRAERNVTYPRAALAKAFLNRNRRIIGPRAERSLQVSLDLGNTNIGYRLGMLFALLERVQEEARPGAKTTIKDYFYGMASSLPQSVFPSLLRIHTQNLLRARTRLTSLENVIQEVLKAIEPDMRFPQHLSLDDQARFAVGYYHQRRSFYARRPLLAHENMQ